MIMVQLARLKLQHVLTAGVLVRHNMLISNSHMQWVLLSAWY